jgi:5'-methylthioadenosine phosphorylase
LSNERQARWTLGVIGGSGLYDIDDLEDVTALDVATPFGPPSETITAGWIGDVRLLFLPRHGRGHRLSPSEVPYRANIHALRQLGADGVLSISAVGSMREDIEPGHVVVPDQLIDRTRSGRPSTFFEGGLVAHVQLADPYCPGLRHGIAEAARAAGADVHNGGTLLVMEGPAFSTRAESLLYRSWGVDVIGMTALPEAKLAREAELCYATLALATDYDCWHATEEDVTVEAVLAVLRRNTALARRVLRGLVDRLPPEGHCACHEALRDAIITGREHVTPAARERLGLLLRKYGY